MASVARYRRPQFAQVLERVSGPRFAFQVLAGPRQVGKTTLARQVREAAGLPSHSASADHPAGRDVAWLEAQWETGRRLARDAGERGALLVLDEVQKVKDWADLVKFMWDADSAEGLPLKVLLLGSSPLLVQHGLTESLAGRFELIRLPHWFFPEMRDAFGWTVEQYVFFGGYPGSAPLIEDFEHWSQYVLDSLVETTISRDILAMTRINKPALLRQLFGLACEFSGQILSYNKMLGQLQDAGNTTTLAHYLEVLSGVGMVMGLPRFTGSKVRQRGSSPKLVVLNTALMTASMGRPFEEVRSDRETWGRLVETAVGAHLVNGAAGSAREVLYWRDDGHEIDYVVRERKEIAGIEVTTGRRKDARPGLKPFVELHHPKTTVIVGGQGLSLEDFLSGRIEDILSTGPEARWS